jgi:hypothetical protein
MPNQSMMYAARVFASTQLPAVMHSSATCAAARSA